MPTLASVAELAAYIGKEIAPDDPAANLALESATAIVQNETRQTLYFVADETVRLRGGTAVLDLPERPVVGTPTVAGHEPTGYVYNAVNGSLRRSYGDAWPETVEVTYSHGYAEIPADLRAVTLSIAEKLLDRVGGNVVQESIGSYSVTYGREGFRLDESRILARYRRSTWAAALA